jgi:hypothetical protein
MKKRIAEVRAIEILQSRHRRTEKSTDEKKPADRNQRVFSL